MILSKAGRGLATPLATPLAVLVASLAMLAAVVVVHASAQEAATPMKVGDAFQVTAPNAPNNAGIVEPYPDEFDIDIGEDESLLFAGTWDAPSKLWTDFFVESDVPVLLNRITAGPSSRLSWGAPGGLVSVIVKTNCNSNNDTVLESETMEIDPIVSTEMVTVNGHTIPKISIVALTTDDDILPPPPSEPSIPLAESRMADAENGNSPNFLPSSDFIHDYECWGGWKTCAPKTPEGSSLSAQGASPDAGTMDAVNDRPARSSTIDATDSVTDYRPAPTEGPVSSSPIDTTSTTANGASESASSAASAKITLNLLLGVVTTASMLMLGTVGILFDKHQRNTIIGAATAIAVFGVMCVAILPPQAHSWSSLEDADGGSRRSLNDAQPQCTINVEIVYWGCDHQVYIDAPGVRLRNGVETSESDWETCECQEQQRFVNTTTTTTTTDRGGDETPERIAKVGITNDLGERSMVYHESGVGLGPSCFKAIGRPYRDNTGTIVSAGICDGIKDEPSENDDHDTSGRETEHPWSEPSLSFLSNVAVNLGGVRDAPGTPRRLGGSSNDDTPQRKERERLGQEWTDRALGEHASVASFAAFTLALMSNQAPPELIRDSLTAAQDEWRHAKVSFEIASMLSGGIVLEPTALPPSTLQFDANRTALALGTAREGCVEETLSAIEMAVEYDEFVAAGGDSDGSDDDDFAATLTSIMETTKLIALEEGNHAVLAWRTIAWICSGNNNSNSNEACKAVHQQVLDPSKLAHAGEKRFSSSPRARQIWDCIWTSLLPAIAVRGETNDTVNGTTNENIIHGYEKCDLEGTNAAKLSELLAHKIVSQVRLDHAIVGAKKGIAATK